MAYGNWGSYIATQEMLEQKGQPLYLAPYERPSEVAQAIDEQFPGQFLGFTDYGSFWEQIVYAGIEKPGVMPHLGPYHKEDWKKSRVKKCLVCNTVI